MSDSALVFCHDRLAGILRKEEAGFEFRYDSAYLEDKNARAISFSLPLRREAYKSEILFPFFQGLLPEGWLLDITTRTAKIDKGDKFELLIHVGRDPIGAVRVERLQERKDD